MKLIKTLTLLVAFFALFTSCKDEYVEVEKPKIYRFEYEAEDWEWDYNDDNTIQSHDVRNEVASYLHSDYLVFVYLDYYGGLYQIPFTGTSFSYAFGYSEAEMSIFKTCIDGFHWTSKSDEDFVIYLMDPEYTEEFNIQNQKSVNEFLSRKFPQDAEMLNNIKSAI